MSSSDRNSKNSSEKTTPCSELAPDFYEETNSEERGVNNREFNYQKNITGGGDITGGFKVSGVIAVKMSVL